MLYEMESVRDHVILRLIYGNHRILLDFFYRVQIDEIQHRTTKTMTKRNALFDFFNSRNSI